MIFNPPSCPVMSVVLQCAPMCSRYDASNFGNLEHGPQVFVSLKCNALEKPRVGLDGICAAHWALSGTHQLATGWTLLTATLAKLHLTHGAPSSVRSGGSWKNNEKMHDQGCSNLRSRMMSHVCSACTVCEASECRTHASRCTKTTLRSSLIIWQHSTFDAILPLWGHACLAWCCSGCPELGYVRYSQA